MYLKEKKYTGKIKIIPLNERKFDKRDQFESTKM